MFGIEVHRTQRALLAGLSAVLLTGVIATLVLASSARERAETSAAATAHRAVQEVLGPELTPSDLAQPVTGQRSQAVRSLVTERLLSAGQADAVRIYNPEGTVVFSTDRADVGTREPNERPRLTRVIQQGRESVVDPSTATFRIFVPLRLEAAGGPPRGVVELDRPWEPLWASATRSWRIATIVLGIGLIGALAMLALTFRDSFTRVSSPKDPAATLPNAFTDSDTQRLLTAAEERARRAELASDAADRRYADAQSELEKTRVAIRELDAARELAAQDEEAIREVEELHRRVRVLEAERETLEERLLASEQRPEGPARETDLDALERLAAAEAAQENLERRAIELERQLADAIDTRAGLQQALADVDRSEASQEQAPLARIDEADAARVAADQRAASAEQRATMSDDRAAQAERRAAALMHKLEELESAVAVRTDAPQDAGELAEVREHAERLERALREVTGRAASTERELELARDDVAAARLETEALQRRERLQDALLHLRAEQGAGSEEAEAGAPLEDRRASAPFQQQLSSDARSAVAAIEGLVLAMRHQEPRADPGPLLRKLGAHARKLDRLIADLLDADRLARGEITLDYRRTELDILVRRVVEETGIDPGDHPVQIYSQPVEVGVDPIRAEEIVSGLLAGAAARAKPQEEIVVRVGPAEGGALIIVEDDEPSSDASMSPVVARFADVHGGWATVEGRQGGGSAFRVFLPDHAADGTPGAEGDVTIMLPDTSSHGLNTP